MMQKVRTVSFGSSSSLAISMSSSKRKKNKWLKARQLRAVDALQELRGAKNVQPIPADENLTRERNQNDV